MKSVYDEDSVGRRAVSLVKLADGDFMLLTPESRLNTTGTKEDVALALGQLGFPQEDLELACADMEAKRTNVAEFGLFTFSFMYSHFSSKYAAKRLDA